ncbi:MAG: hypothetical protein I8H80_01660 [Alphaproteobacteria bacterium]|nr:hypothetical protein [Alphaproteobacteria bacterium]
MKKILTLVVVCGHMLTTVCGADTRDERSALSVSELCVLTAELREIQSTVQTLQDQVIAHEKTSSLSNPPIFCLMFTGDPEVENVVQIKAVQSQIEYIQDTHDSINDETTKADLASRLVELRAAFDSEMEKKSQYEAAVAELLRLKANLDACATRMQEIQRNVVGHMPQQPEQVSMIVAKEFFAKISNVTSASIVKYAKELGIHNPPEFCMQYVCDVNVVNEYAVQQARKEHETFVRKLQDQIAISNEDDKADLAMILKRNQKNFDDKLAKVSEYKAAVTKLRTFQETMNAKTIALVTSMHVEVARLASNPEALKLLCDTKLQELEQVN